MFLLVEPRTKPRHEAPSPLHCPKTSEHSHKFVMLRDFDEERVGVTWQGPDSIPPRLQPSLLPPQTCFPPKRAPIICHLMSSDSLTPTISDWRTHDSSVCFLWSLLLNATEQNHLLLLPLGENQQAQ